jgi:hypothetical protein
MDPTNRFQMADRVLREGGGPRVSQFVVFQKLGRNLRDRPDVLPVGDVVEGPFELLTALLLGFVRDGFPARFARFLDTAPGEREVVPIDFRLLQFAGLFVGVFGSVNGHIDRLSLLPSRRRHGRCGCLDDSPDRVVDNPPDRFAGFPRKSLEQGLRLGSD